MNGLPTIFVILGATGDLMRKKLAPSLFRLWEKGMLPPLFQVIGFARQELTDEAFRQEVTVMLEERNVGEPEKIREFVKLFRYQSGIFEEIAGYKEIAEILGRKDEEWQVCANKLFYLAVPPQFYEVIFKKLDDSGLTEPCSPEEGWTRVIVEKPFGNDLETAQKMDELLGKLFQEEQIYRMDHYLGKETTQNILAFRFSNSFLQPLWNNKGIEQIYIKLYEAFDIQDRGAFYDGIGALRDVGQNHMLQLLALFCMEQPGDFTAASIRKAKTEVLKKLKTFSEKEVRLHTNRAQYEGYRQEKNVDPESETETYFRIQAFLENPRWQGIPIILESGKALEKSLVEVEVTFRHDTPCLCPDPKKHYKNVLHYEIEPKEGVRISVWAKKPGYGVEIEEKELSFDYKAAFGKEAFMDAYEKLVNDSILGDQTSFVSTEEIMAEWKFIDPILREWQKGVVELQHYPEGTVPKP